MLLIAAGLMVGFWQWQANSIAQSPNFGWLNLRLVLDNDRIFGMVFALLCCAVGCFCYAISHPRIAERIDETGRT